MQAQIAARHSAEEAQQVYRDILAWTRKQKEKDRALCAKLSDVDLGPEEDNSKPE